MSIVLPSTESDTPGNLAAEFMNLSGLNVRRGAFGSTHTTFHIGGEFEYLVEAHSTEELLKALRAFSDLELGYRVLGFGSNILLPDEGISGWTLKLGTGLRSFEAKGGGVFEVGGAMSLMTLSRKLSDIGYSGLEFAGGIPASVGGAVYMNAGAHGGEMSEIVDSVLVCLQGGELVSLPAVDLNFSYRHSELPDGAIVCSTTLKLVHSSREKTNELRAENLKARKASQPLTMPSAGSVFKNPTPDSTAGMLIDKVGLRGEMRGGAQISDIHGNWIVNTAKEAKAEDVKFLVDLCQQRVQERFNIQLQREVIYW